jgi:hypothetical protein
MNYDKGPPGLNAEPAGVQDPAGQNRRQYRPSTAGNNPSRCRGRQVRHLVAISCALPPTVWNRLRTLALKEDQTCPR